VHNSYLLVLERLPKKTQAKLAGTRPTPKGSRLKPKLAAKRKR
jgi:hypothetical protein